MGRDGWRFYLHIVIAGLVPATHTLRDAVVRMGGRDKPGHDGWVLRESEPRRHGPPECGPPR